LTAKDRHWLFPVDALKGDPGGSPDKASTSIAAATEARARGIEYLFRVGVQLQMSLSAILTASTYFHRSYARNSIIDYPPTCVASASILVASKSEECGRRLKDVAMVCMSKATSGLPPLDDELTELEDWQNMILKTEDLLLEVLGFDFAVKHPHAVLSEIFTDPHSKYLKYLKARQDSVEDLAWSIATDSYRTPLCILTDPATVALACLAIAVALAEGEQSSYLEQLVRYQCGTELLSPRNDSLGYTFWCVCIDHYFPPPKELRSAVVILLQFYRFQWLPAATLAPGQDHFLAPIANLSIPKHDNTDILQLYAHPLQEPSPNPSSDR